MAKINSTTLKQLLHKEAQEQLSPAEQIMLDEWYSSFDETQKNKTIFKDTAHENEIRLRLFNRIIASGFPEAEAPSRKAKYRRIIYWSSAAAIFLMLIGGLFFRSKFSKSGNPDEALQLTETGNGMIKKINLADGTEIWLNAGSKLRYPDQFSRGRREVYLEGEAYFNVKHNPTWPFVVHTLHLTTNVLGTSFTVTAYKTANSQSVSVVAGKVSVAHNHTLLGMLTPNKKVEYNVSTGKSTLSNADAAQANSWKDGKLQFDNQDMQDIAGRLGRWYGYTFKFEHKNIGNCRYTASFDSNIPLHNLLHVMQSISLVNYRIDTEQKTVTFLGTGCNE